MYTLTPNSQDVVCSERRFAYEEAVRADPLNYDAWFDYARLEESAGELDRTREVRNRGVCVGVRVRGWVGGTTRVGGLRCCFSGRLLALQQPAAPTSPQPPLHHSPCSLSSLPMFLPFIRSPTPCPPFPPA